MLDITDLIFSTPTRKADADLFALPYGKGGLGLVPMPLRDNAKEFR